MALGHLTENRRFTLKQVTTGKALCQSCTTSTPHIFHGGWTGGFVFTSNIETGSHGNHSVTLTLWNLMPNGRGPSSPQNSGCSGSCLLGISDKSAMFVTKEGSKMPISCGSDMERQREREKRGEGKKD